MILVFYLNWVWNFLMNGIVYELDWRLASLIQNGLFCLVSGLQGMSQRLTRVFHLLIISNQDFRSRGKNSGCPIQWAPFIYQWPLAPQWIGNSMRVQLTIPNQAMT